MNAYRPRADSPADTTELWIAATARIHIAANSFAHQEATVTSTTAGDYTIDAAASFNVTLTDDDADALDFANSASSYYFIDTRNTVAGIFAHHFDTEDAVLADSASAVYGLVKFAAHSVTLAGTTQVTTRGVMVDIEAQTILASGGAVTVNDWDTLRLVAPTEGTDVTLVDAVALHIINAGGTPTTQYGFLIDDLTVGTGSNVGIQWTGHLIYTAGLWQSQEALIIETTTGDLTLKPGGGDVNFFGNNAIRIGELRGANGAPLEIYANQNDGGSPARRINLGTIDTSGDAKVLTAYAVPTATETTPFWAQRADVTTPLTNTLDASFLTFLWNPSDDVVTVFVNDGGTIRKIAIGTVV